MGGDDGDNHRDDDDDDLDGFALFNGSDFFLFWHAPNSVNFNWIF